MTRGRLLRKISVIQPPKSRAATRVASPVKQHATGRCYSVCDCAFARACAVAAARSRCLRKRSFFNLISMSLACCLRLFSFACCIVSGFVNSLARIFVSHALCDGHLLRHLLFGVYQQAFADGHQPIMRSSAD